MDNYRGFDSWLRVRDCCAGTIVDRRHVLAHFARDTPSFPHCTPAQVTDWLGQPKFGQWTRCTYYGHLTSYFTWAVGVGLIDTHPMSDLKRPKRRRGVPRPLSPAQVGLVLGAPNLNMHAWLTLGLYAGLRAHEIAKIRGEDVDAEQLFVCGKGDEDDYLPTHPLVWALAQTRPRTGWWFPSGSASGHVTSRAVSTLTSRLFAANGIDGSIHRCRHTFATELLRSGVNVRVVQSLMRHRSLESTMVYTAVDECERRDAIRLLAA